MINISSIKQGKKIDKSLRIRINSIKFIIIAQNK